MPPLADAQKDLIAEYLLIEDPQERFSAIVDRARFSAQFPEELRKDENQVRGCTSRVWLTGEVRGGLCQFLADSESAILKGVIHLLVQLYSGHPPDEVIATEPDFLRTLRILDQLTLTRRNGLRQVRARMVEIARGDGGS